VVTIHGFYETPTWQLGDDFFRAWCAALDVQGRRIGFARHKKNMPKDEENAANGLKLGFMLLAVLLFVQF
jgi:hypothetical protein